ncbi:UDP-xylose and UDP-N-acetylglucosamine transporter-like [Tropilaelaps mercedesae]|uniref:UDP-xylose and UDP-N-acetylglucosamine transporter-like n=1 Tax=Tropilaelaps mercedesae TaxID=418985 RepID=A0A1V9XMP9_9ACAR|nr:UDP-xylose and UDP-N-acetylglucosamine transporter-like [Tropilaelaps mercedesae]
MPVPKMVDSHPISSVLSDSLSTNERNVDEGASNGAPLVTAPRMDGDPTTNESSANVLLTNLRRRMASAFGLNTAPMSTVGMTFGACCSNVVFLEQLVRLEPSCTALVTFAQFAFIAVEKFFSETRCFRKRRTVPLSRYFQMVGVFFAQSFLNNYALSFHIPMPLHMIFKSASLLFNMLLGIIILHRSYSLRKYSAVTLVTVGIVLCTAASTAPRSQINDAKNGQLVFSMTQIIGIAILIVALLLSSLMGILQEKVTADFGKYPGEMMFYIHAMALPAFALFTPQMWQSLQVLSRTQSSWLTLGLPVGIGALVANVLTQFVCISSVFRLSTECTSLTVTLVVTLRKFISLIISIFYFGNEFSRQHWIGTVFVFVGTLLFLDQPTPRRDTDKKEV